MRRLAAVGCMLLLATGCALSEDEEMRPRTVRTRVETQAPTPLRALPARIPAPGPDAPADVGPGSHTRVDGAVLVVDDRRVDLAPMRAQAWVVVPGGVYFVDGGTLWFTDLDRVRDTGLAQVQRLETTPDRSRVRVRFSGSAEPSAYAFDTGTGARVEPEGLDTVPAERPAGAAG